MATRKKKRAVNSSSAMKKSPNKASSQAGFQRPLTSVDLAIFAVRDDNLYVLLVQRPDSDDEPYPGQSALPGGFIDTDQDENLVACASRKLFEKTGVEAQYLEQVGSWGDASRDPRGWSTTHVYFALIEYVHSSDLANQSKWVAVEQAFKNDRMAFDHLSLLKAAIDRLRSKVEYTSLPAYLLQAPFTLPQLQHVYEVILDRSLDKSSFRTRTLSANYLEETGLMKVEAPRPAMGYCIKPDQNLVYFPRPLKGDN